MGSETAILLGLGVSVLFGLVWRTVRSGLARPARSATPPPDRATGNRRRVDEVGPPTAPPDPQPRPETAAPDPPGAPHRQTPVPPVPPPPLTTAHQTTHAASHHSNALMPARPATTAPADSNGRQPAPTPHSDRTTPSRQAPDAAPHTNTEAPSRPGNPPLAAAATPLPANDIGTPEHTDTAADPVGRQPAPTPQSDQTTPSRQAPDAAPYPEAEAHPRPGTPRPAAAATPLPANDIGSPEHTDTAAEPDGRQPDAAPHTDAEAPSRPATPRPAAPATPLPANDIPSPERADTAAAPDGQHPVPAPKADRPAASAPASAAAPLPAAPIMPTRAAALLAEGGYNQAYCHDPVITFTAIQWDRSFLAEWMAGPTPAFGTRRGVHFLKPTWTMEQSPLTALRSAIHAAEACNPGHLFVALHASPREAERYRQMGIASIAANCSLFADEATLPCDAAPHPDLPEADALYIARLDPWKRHDLALRVPSLLFVYSDPDSPEMAGQMRQLQAACPAACFVNHRLGGGRYLYLKRPDLARTMARAKVALALSAVEGFMRASTECLLAGLPVVSTPSVGGRDAFYTPDTALIVAPEAGAVRDGVAAMIARGLSRHEVRSATLALMRAERARFLWAANRIARAHLGPAAPEITMKPLLDFTIRYGPLSRMIGELT